MLRVTASSLRAWRFVGSCARCKGTARAINHACVMNACATAPSKLMNMSDAVFVALSFAAAP
eukprot:9476401-Pyramimonas_sp.AAC.2